MMSSRKFLIITLLALIALPFFIYISGVNAQAQYTVEDVSIHNTADDCWMIYGEYVYDFTSFLDWHKKFIDVTPWCGLDMTEDFQTKGDLGKDHIPSSYRLLTDYILGDLFAEGVVVEEPVVIEEKISEQEETIKSIASVDVEEEPSGPYNLAVPLGLSVVLYVGFYILSGSKIGKSNKYLSRTSFNLFWNTILFLSLIPAFGFGIFMMMRYQHPDWYNIDFKFLYWHVEFSVVMGSVAIMHFIQRFKQYTTPLKILKMK